MRHGHPPALQPGFPAYAAHCKRHAGEAGEPDSISAVARRTAERYLVELIDVTEERQAIEQTQDAQIGYRVEMDGCDDVFLVGDRMRLNQVIVNFISNALKFTDAGDSVTVTVDALGVFGIPFPDVSFNRSVTIYPPMIDVVVLPGSVTEIFGGAAYGGHSLPGAFEGTGGTWALDWESATHLQYIDRNAFKNSGIQGSVLIDQPNEYVWIGMSAFDGCAGLTSIDITLGEHVMSLDLYGPGAGYTFTGLEGEEDRIRLHMPDDGQVQRAYLDAWTYRFAGYTDYDSMYTQLETELIDWDTFEWPTEAQVRKEMAARLLEPENRLRAMMGLPTVDASTVVVVEDADTEDPAAQPENEPDALANVKSTAEAGRIDGSAGVSGYDGIWCPTDTTNEADAAETDFADKGEGPSSSDVNGDTGFQPATDAIGARPTDTEPSTGA